MTASGRVTGWILLAMAVASLVGTVAVRALLRGTLHERAAIRLGAESLLLASDPRLTEARGLDAFVRQKARDLEARVTLLGDDGYVLADSELPPDGPTVTGSMADRPEIAEARRKGAGQSRRTAGSTGIEHLFAARRVDAPGAVRFVRLGLPLDRAGRLDAGGAWLVLLVAVLPVGLVGAVALLALRQAVRPVETMSAAVERVAGGEPRLDLPRGDSPGMERLASAVRQMQSALLDKIAELDAERSVLSSMIAGIHEGLMLIGADRRIRLANQALCDIFDLTFDPVGSRLAEVVRQPTVIETIEAAFSDGQPVDDRIVRLPASGRSFSLHVSSLRSSAEERGELLVLLFDVTKLETLEGVRREFVANVSHELRTPVTSIKAAVETLRDGAVEEPQHATRFLEIIGRQADRMGELIADLTDLSLIETGAISMHPEPISPALVAREVIEQLRPLASNREVELLVDIPETLRLCVDRRRLEQMLTNLVENALKFNRPGGHVQVSASDEGDRVALRISDTGIGLSADDRDKIFNRFYQVDRGRSQQVGGTGLGLAIVKHLMRLHDGRVRVESELGQGATFILEFPRPEAAPA